jgi:hypothetical protein
MRFVVIPGGNPEAGISGQEGASGHREVPAFAGMTAKP